MIDRTKGSTETVGLGAASGITLDTIAVRLSHTKIWASPIWICWTKDRTSSRSSSDASLVQRSASFAEAGVFVRPFRNIVYLTPAFTIGEEDLNRLTGAVVSVLEQWTRL